MRSARTSGFTRHEEREKKEAEEAAEAAEREAIADAVAGA